MSNSLHNVSMGLDMDLSQFTRELNRAQMQFRQWASSNTRNATAMTEAIDHQLEQLMEAAGVPIGPTVMTPQQAQDIVRLGRELDSIIELETDVALRGRMMGININDAFDDASMGALTYEQRLEAANAGQMQCAASARAMGAAGQRAFGQMNQAAGSTNILLSQLGYGIEDFFTVYDTMGPAGALRAASNNLSMVARTLFSSALIGNIAAIGIALGPTLWKYLAGSSEEAENFHEAIKKATDEVERLNEIKATALDARFRLQDIVGSADEKIRLAFAWENPEIKPTVDSSELIAAALEMKQNLKEMFRDAARDAMDLSGKKEQKTLAIDTLLWDAAGGSNLESGLRNAVSSLDSEYDKQRIINEVLEARRVLMERIKESPESAAGALESYRNRLEVINQELMNAWAYSNGWGNSLDSAEYYLSSFPTILEDASAQVQTLLDDQEGMNAFVEQQIELQREIAKLEQAGVDRENERLATLREQEKLMAAAAEKRRQELREKQLEAQDSLLEKAASKEKAALWEVYQAQMEILKLRQEALGDNPNAMLTQQVNAAASAAMRNLLQDAAEKFGEDVKKEIDHLKENFIIQRTTGDAQRAALTSALQQRQEAAKREEKNTAILEAIRDALQNNALVMVPVN